MELNITRFLKNNYLFKDKLLAFLEQKDCTIQAGKPDILSWYFVKITIV